MLQDVGNPRGVAGRSWKKDGEAVVVVWAVDMNVPRACARVQQLDVSTFDSLQRLAARDRVAAESAHRGRGHVNR